MPKRERTPFEETAYKAFAGMPIDKWEGFITENVKKAKTDERAKVERAYKVIASRCLTIPNMSAYILAHDNTDEAKKAFGKACWGIKYLKDEKGQYVKDGENLIPVIDKETGKPVKIRSVVYAKKYFIKKYAQYLKLEDLPTAEKKFEAIDSWYDPDEDED